MLRIPVVIGALLLSLATAAGPSVAAAETTGAKADAQGKTPPPPKTFTPEEWRNRCLKMLLADNLITLVASQLSDSYAKLSKDQEAAVKRLKAELADSRSRNDVRESRRINQQYQYAVALVEWLKKMQAEIASYRDCRRNESLANGYPIQNRDEYLAQVAEARKQVRREVRDLLASKPKPPDPDN